jgi:hypothetical protein
MIMTRYILSDAPPKTSKLNSEIYTKKLQTLMRTAVARNIPYFTTSLNYRKNSSYDRVEPFIRTYKWTGFFGFFKWSENPFDKTFSVAADAEAQQKIVFNLRSLNVLQDTGLIVAMDFVGKKYHTGNEHDRSENYAIINSRYPGIADEMDHNLSKTNHMILDRKVLNRLKKNYTAWRFRDDECYEGERMATCNRCGEEFSDKRKALGYDICLDCGEEQARALAELKKEKLLTRLEKENVYRRK